MNNFDRFQERNKIRAKTTDRGNATFIFKGYNSTIISDGTTQLYAAVVNEQEKDSAYIYTRLTEPLTIGSAWEAKTLHFLITEEIVIIKDVDWHKYAAQLCNVELDGIWGRFIGPEERYVNVSLKEKSIITSQQKPLVILPSGTLQFGDKIIIKNRPWLVQEYDDISTPGITYYSLAPTTVSKDVAAANEGKDFYVERVTTKYTPVETVTSNHVVGHNIDITLSTQDGYFQYNNPNIVVSNRTATSVVFSLPFGVDSVQVQVKQEGQVVTTTYRAE